ncbi:MAG: HDOD domain-containing protein [Stagnimonas sp.]|nr:HDOD domain-containing protein [Stagnimonas sp.]
MLATSASLLSRIHAIPTMPKVVQALISTFDASEVDVPRIARLVNTDPVIAAKVLRLANSSYYHRARAVSTINDAVVFLGLDALRMLVIGAGFAGSVPVPQSLGRNLYWRYCLHTAVAAKFFAAHCDEDSETAFTAGLLHAIGEPLMVTAMESELRDVDLEARFYDHERARCERAAIGFSFSDLGGDLAESWCFPAAVVAAIRTAPEPLEQTVFSRLGACVYLGAHFAAAHERSESVEQAASTLDARVLDSVGIDLAKAFDMPPVRVLAQGLEELVA